ncbi:transposase [Ktedonobacter sp. SOSP1-85]|uniref:ISL3 family transposase n=1 Tax=Ktedonobacter sp. SOSP1-85 TaxID=2778367 RepID=UPI001916C723|nr:ISL3 family transposase [Ktedonobacter sp. SOSP1-85]GHO77948.1 transposase [Ktedonobacter sp. SOSP1-85]
MIIFPDLPHVEVEGVEIAEEITLTLRTTSPTAPCPSCGTVSSRIQSLYSRALRDLPSVGRPLRLILHVRRFFCKKNTCAQKIFVERLPELCHPHAQRTKRLQKALCELGLKIGGQAGADVGSELGISGSRDTILRLVRQSHPSAQSAPHVIGLDDWARRRRLRYGTLICDLELGLPIDLLPDRSVKTVSTWLLKHPSIKVVSRDGSSEYASAIQKGAPQAVQVSDRWHLVKNLAACVSVQLTQSLTQLRRAEQTEAKTLDGQQPSPERQSHPRTRAEKRAQHARQAERTARYEQMMALQQQGMKSIEIAAHMGMAPRTVREWLDRGDIPYSGSRKPRTRLIDPYKTYLLERWQQGCRQGVQLERELRAKGYKGSPRAIYRYLETVDALSFSARKSGSQLATKPLNPLLTLSAPQATWLFFRKHEDLKEEERETLQQLRQMSPHLETAYQLVEMFLHMVRERTGEQLDAWLAAVKASHLEAFESFVTGVQQDKDAVLAGLTLPWSNGPLEGNVNRLKLIKRSMYGRAEIDLLKLRVLHHSKKSQERKRKQKQQVAHLKKPKSMKNGVISQHTTTAISKVA